MNTRFFVSWFRLLSFLFFPLLSTKIFADTVELSRSAATNETELSLFAGIGGGYSSISGENFDGHLSGRLISGFGLLSPRLGRWFGDVGLGWQQERVAGRTSIDERVEMITQSAVLDINPSIGFLEHWQVGPLASALFGADHRYGVETEAPNQILMWGARLSYEWRPDPDWRLRFYGQMVRESTIQERTVVNSTIGIMVGIPVTKRAEPVAITADTLPAKSDVRLNLDPELVFFQTGSSALKSNVKDILKVIAEKLKLAAVEWESVEVLGHTDQRGTSEYNMQLSERRANAVSDRLVASGIERAKVKVSYFGKAQPRNPGRDTVALAENRRVEVVFHGVKDPERLQAILQPLEEFKPEIGR